MTYSLFEAGQAAAAPGLTKKQEEFLNKYTKGSWKYNPTSGLVDVVGDFDCGQERLKTLSGVKFGKVSGDFDCRNNQLTSLEGAPLEVGGYFECERNQLTSLEGAPQEVRGIFSCEKNRLTTLKGAPQKVGEHFVCDVFRLRDGEWNLNGWLKVLKEGSSEAQKLISTLMSPEVLNKEIQKDPAGMIMKLKSVWNSPDFKDTKSKLVCPQGYGEEMDIVGGLNTIGF